LGEKKQRIVTVMQAIEETPRPTSAPKITLAAKVSTAIEAAPTEATTAEATTAEATNLESTLSDIDRILLDMVVEKLLQLLKKPWPQCLEKGRRSPKIFRRKKTSIFKI
jgi:hypothetical protein